jgi:uncharacterized protein (TIGR03435 family)
MRGRVVAALILCGVVALGAQTPKPTFEVASVKRNLSGKAGYRMGPRPGGAYDADNVPISVLIEFAYEVPGYLLVGGGSWPRTSRFDIAARAGRDAPIAETKLMMQALLEDRFSLVVHRERRDMSHFVLVKARSDGRLGPDLKRVAENCGASKSPEPRANQSSDKPWETLSAGGRSCGAPISAIADLASRVLDTLVIDKTGLDGGWDYSLRFGSTLGQSFGSLTEVASDPSVTSFSTMLDERLGLKLQPTRSPVDVLVIDSVQQPTAN